MENSYAENDEKNKLNPGVHIQQEALGIFIRDGKLALMLNKRDKYYQFIGGISKVKSGDLKDSLVAKFKDEVNLTAIPDSIKKYSQVSRVEKQANNDIQIREYHFLFVDCKEKNLDVIIPKDSEFEFRLIDPKLALKANIEYLSSLKNEKKLIDVETGIIQKLIDEDSYFA